MGTNRFDIYSMITDRIIKQLDNGIIPWHKPWNGGTGGAYSRTTGKPYSFINQMLIGRTGEYATFNQIKKEGGKVNKGAKSEVVVFYKMYKNKSKDEQGEETERTFPVLRYYRVFNIEDTDLEPKNRENTNITENMEAEDVISSYVANTGVDVENKHQDRAYYQPSTDNVVLPLITQFTDVSEYYSTAFHELVHSTGHKSRFDRFETGAKTAAFGSEEYSREELVAEIGAAALNNLCGIETERSFKNSTSYCQSWAKHLKENVKEIVSASSRAEKAVKLIAYNEM